MGKLVADLQRGHWSGWQRASTIIEGESYQWRGIAFECDNVCGQCGASVIHDVRFNDSLEEDEDLFTDMLLEVGRSSKDAAIYLASDVVGGMLHGLLNREPWQAGAIARNPNSDNLIQIFELLLIPGE